MKAEAFDSWSEAFDVCRERNRPLVVLVDREVAKIFPSGHSELICTLPVDPVVVVDAAAAVDYYE